MLIDDMLLDNDDSSELVSIITEDTTLKGNSIKHARFIKMAIAFEEELEDNLFLTSLNLASKYNDYTSTQWREFLEHPTVKVFKDKLVDEIQVANAEKTLAENALSNSDAIKMKTERSKNKGNNDNANIVVFFMGMRDYGDQKKIEKYESPDELTLRKTKSGEIVYRCPVCETGEVSVQRPNFYGDCDTCGASVIDFVPLEHQHNMLMAKETYKLVLGGYGSGKTSVSIADLIAHALTTPSGRAAVVAQSLDQVRRTVLKEIEKILPPKFIKKQTKSPIEIRLTNGYEIFVYASDNEEKIRSLEVDYFYIEEASDPKLKWIFDQSSARIRRHTGQIFDENGVEIDNKYQVVMASNPEDTWFMEGFILKAKHISASPSVNKDIYTKLQFKNPEPNYHVFLSSTRDNNYLSKSYLSNLTAGKTPNWIRKYIDCYLDVKEGRVYDDYLDHFVKPFPIPNSWRRVAGYDFGVQDPTAFLVGAEDPDSGIVYFYDAYSKRDKPVDFHANHIVEMMTYNDGYGRKRYDLLYPIQADPAVKKRNDRDMQSHQTYFQSRTGLVLEPADNRIDIGIAKVKNLMYLGRIKFFEDIGDEIKDEFRNYTYSMDKDTHSYTDKPIDRWNHLMDALRYTCMRLPENTKGMVTYAQPVFNEEGNGAFTYNPSTKEFKKTDGTIGRNRVVVARPRGR